MDLNELAQQYWRLHLEAEKVGLEQKSNEYKAIFNALNHVDFAEKYGRVHFPIDYIIGYHPYYEKNPFRSWPRFMKRSDETWLKAIKIYLTDEWHWDANTYPSFASCFKSLWENVKVIFCWTMAPWLHIRYRFIQCFANYNNSKLLDDGMSWTYVRNREADTVYYELSFFWFHYTLKKWRWLKEGETEGRNTFMDGLVLAFDDSKTDDEKGEEAEKIKKVEEKVCSGWVFGWRSFVKQMNKIIEKTPDLAWTKYVSF